MKIYYEPLWRVLVKDRKNVIVLLRLVQFTPIDGL